MYVALSGLRSAGKRIRTISRGDRRRTGNNADMTWSVAWKMVATCLS